MKRYAYVLALTLCACNPNKTALDANYHPTERNWGSLQPVWRDEFDDPKSIQVPDPDKWVVAEYCNGWNNEEQCYDSGNITVSGGLLTITAKRDTCSGTAHNDTLLVNEQGTVACTGSGTANYSSGRLHTRVLSPPGPHTWKYGRVEIRAKLAYGGGTWSAFWMMPHPEKYKTWPQSGEIDILEAVNLRSPNASPDAVESNVHLCSPPGTYYTTKQQPNSGCPKLSNDFPGINYQQAHIPQKLLLSPDSGGCWPDLSNGFHTYALEWNEWQMRFYLDDQLIHTVWHGPDAQKVAPFREPFYLIVNLAIGGDMPNGNPPTKTTDTTTWLGGGGSTPNPVAKLVLDWVRIYECVTDATAKNCMFQGQGLGRKPPSVTTVQLCHTATLPE